MNIIKRYFVNLSNLKLVSYLIVLNMINFLSPISALGFENKFEKSKYINKVDSSKILEPNSENFPKLYGENLITQQSSSTNLNLNQAIKNFDKAEELILSYCNLKYSVITNDQIKIIQKRDSANYLICIYEPLK